MAGIIQALTFYLASAIDATQTSIQVRGLKDSRGNNITAMPVGVTILYATIEPRSPSNQEIISFNGITDNGNGIVTLTGVIRNLNPQPPFTALTANVAHGNNAEIILSNNPPFYSGFLQSDSNITITGSFLFPTPTLAANPATKAYVDGVAYSGAPDADLLTKGVVRLSLDPSVSLGNPTITIASPAVVTLALHGLTLNDTVKFTTSGNLPTGLVVGVTYYVMSTGLTANTFQLTATINGVTPIATTGSQSGTHTLFRTTPRAVGDNDTRLPSPSQIANFPTAGEKAALAGSQAVVGASNKYITEDNVYNADIDQSQTTQNALVEVGESNVTTKKSLLAQSFTAGKTKIKGVRLYKSANTGSFTGTFKVAIQADAAGSPSGSDLVSVTLTNAQYLAFAVGEFEALFGSEYASLVLGSLYWIVVTTSTADTANHPNLGTNSAGGYAGGSAKYQNSTDGWVAIATIDLYFKTIQGVVGQVSKNQVVVKTYTASGFWTKPAGLVSMTVEILAGGGGGGGSTNVTNGGGGGSGTYAWRRFLAAQLNAIETLTVGAGGTSGSGGTGGTGGTTSFGSWFSALGGVGGQGAGSNTGGVGGAVTAGVFSLAGTAGNNSSSGTGGAGGNSFYGLGGVANTSGGAGNNGSNGGGGGGGFSNNVGGVGGAGLIIITEYYY